MIEFRKAEEKDFLAIYQLAQLSGVGLTTLPKDKTLLAERLAWSCRSFQSNTEEAAYYLFVLEDRALGKIIGTSALETKVGEHSPFYSFKISKHCQYSTSLQIKHEYEMLHLVNDYQGCTELCTLFLDPAFRGRFNGLCLSKSRFLFMANEAQRFNAPLIAELRGVSSEKGESLFWEHIGQPFFQLPFYTADELSLKDKQFIAELMPSHPIYLPLLPTAVQDLIGQAHTLTRPALHMLLQEGFVYRNYIDIFDGGPTVEAKKEDLLSLRDSKIVSVKVKDAPPPNNSCFLLANLHEGYDFRASYGEAYIDLGENRCILPSALAEILAVNSGENIRILPISHRQNSRFKESAYV